MKYLSGLGPPLAGVFSVSLHEILREFPISLGVTLYLTVRLGDTSVSLEYLSYNSQASYKFPFSPLATQS